ncbi:UDP-glucuronosyl/UDP-glucosyltransferase [Sesbania bispinosa]|nr:UDP-glucuronosyl/UDP-glucosyltransferase [Sesbania bispinosa]
MSKAHILVFPYPALGHMFPLLQLTHHLALGGSLTITIITTPKNLPILNPLLSTHPNTIQTLILPFPSHPNIPPGAENVREVGNSGVYPFICALSNLQNPITQWFSSHPNPPVAIISDFFLGWTHQLATQLGIPRLAFYSSGAFMTALDLSCLHNLRFLQSQAVIKFAGIPRTPSFRCDHLPTLFLCYRESELVGESFLANASSWGSIFNTFHALEGPYLDHIRAQLGHQRVFAVGPLGSNRVKMDPGGESNVLRWLDQWEEEGSVLYVCFGSQKLLRKEQMEALAFGLERSGTRFVWVVKAALMAEQAEEGYGLVPDGFEDRVSSRGIVVRDWAPQVEVLGHRVVGGFLSHCGWNSVMEAVAAGVMILGWPMEADQFVNARLLVEEKGMAVKVCEGEDFVPDPDELGRVISGAMSGDSPQKRRAKLMREEAIRSVSEGGRSSKELDELVEVLQQQLGVKEG